ncbi:cyclopropane-fatty-acyl-phospholipid synthase family protein [Gordonia sp. OPL2]|uniref:SAM-dependent methyltransferase n=1 Tax=Gordonia sp. OPL2 TaxID=2486274 RepID=UPI001656751A|nr:cyclopropane-fatty-acyl-phospholipid synthase family protein [Gordonia sp. OPL2]ROZ93751.1 class I SAM-dependent methyltransferase [Gordonia sp. OPL2]
MSVASEIAETLARHLGGELPVHLTAWDGSSAGPADAPRVVLYSPDAVRRILWHPGELGAAQAYVTGELDVRDDLDIALTHVWDWARTRQLPGRRVTPRLLLDVARLAWRLDVLGLPTPAPASQAKVRGRLHSMTRDRAAISHHYDLSNDFYELILDSHMAYSSAYWTSTDPGYTLDDAQADKLDLVCRKVGLDRRPGMRLLDIGCGWGSLSLRAAEQFGAQVVGVTISAEQKAFIDARVAERGLTDQVEIRVQDYRAIPDGPFDAVASVEMGEHVGQRNYPVYAQTLHDKVAPGGLVCIQQMSRPAGNHPGGGPFIESFIAPDMYMRPLGQTVEMLEDAGLEVRDTEAMREHYVRTVDVWYETFEKNWAQVVDLVGDEVARVWRLYLVGGRMAFRDGRMGVDQITARRPG